MNLVQEAVTRRPFPQLPFVSEHSFDSFIRNRGFSVGIAGVRSFVASGLIEKLDAGAGDFHPFQIWPISRLFRGFDIQLDAGISYYGLDPTGLRKFIDLNWSRRAKALTDLPKSDLCVEFNRHLFPLLLWLESLFLPVVRGPRPGVVSLTNSDILTWSMWVDRTDFQDLLDKHSISIAQLSGWRDKILFDAFLNDPSADLYLLLRSMPFEQRDRLKGHLRLAYDLYEIAEIIRLFLERVSNQSVTKEWDPTGHPDTVWVKRVYGDQPKFGSPQFLRAVVRSYGLDPAYRVRWLVEGETEQGFILRYTEGLGANIGEFVTIRNFRGDGAFQKQIAAIDADLEAAKEEQCFVTLTFDESGGARKRLERLIESRLVNFRFVLNKPDFELENFTVDQLVEVAATWASDMQCPIGLCTDTLVGEVTSRISEKAEGFEKAFNSVLLLHGEPFKLSKGIEWGQRLGDHLSHTRDSEAKAGIYSELSLSKIERQTLFVLRNSEPFIDYPLSIENVDPTTLEIL